MLYLVGIVVEFAECHIIIFDDFCLFPKAIAAADILLGDVVKAELFLDGLAQLCDVFLLTLAIFARIAVASLLVLPHLMYFFIDCWLRDLGGTADQD